MLPSLSPEEKIRYSRHLILPKFGEEGQQKLKAASVLIIGTGGLGSAISLYLAAAGVGHIGIVDHDSVDPSNLQRQVIHNTNMIGKPKVESARQRMLEVNPTIKVSSYQERFEAQNAEKIAADYDILVDGSDNFATRYLINDLAVFTHKPYVFGAIAHYEGQVSVFNWKGGPCYRCIFPKAPAEQPADAPSRNGVFSPLPGTIGTIEASETIKLITGIGTPLVGRLLLYDSFDMSFQVIDFHKNPNCAICSPKPAISALQDYH